VSQLRSRGWTVVNVREQADGAAQAGADLLARLPFLGPRSIHIEMSLQQIAVMLRGGLTLLSSLSTVAEQAPRASVARLWRKVIDDVQEGLSFSEALERHSCIPHYVVRLVRVGEQTGLLEPVLVRGAQIMQSRREAQREMMTAMAYPALVVIGAVGVSAYMVVYLIPKLGKLLQSLGKELPVMTQLLLDIAAFVQEYGVGILVGLAATAAGCTFIYLSEAGRLWVDGAALRIPILGRIFRIGGTATFAQSLSTLLRSGVTVLEALVTVEQMHYNRRMAQTVRQAREEIMQGKSLAQSLSGSGGYMPLLASMTAVAEQVGSLDEVLDEVARFHQSQMQAVTRQLGAWVTPVVTVIVGGIVGFVYIAFFMALFAAGA
jgi:type IV pilus assembly protein PilC